ncbi:MAG: AAA family ATPase [Steroidobacteraceae bacterium]
MNALQELEARLQARLGDTVIGLGELIRALAIAIVTRGHVLIQGPPGLGKTLLGKSLAAALGGRFTRVQGTADLMPADITGVHVFDEATRRFRLHRGPVFTDVLLVDEINRAGPKTQSALLEAMAERQVSIDRETYRLAADFLVIATQNPHEFEGTFPLPESQLDRFMMRIDLSYPGAHDEAAVLRRYGTIASLAPAGAAVAAAGAVAPELSGASAPGDASSPGSPGASTPGGPTMAAAVPASPSAPASAAVTPEQIAAARDSVDRIHVAPELIQYLLGLAKASREHAEIALGLSTRAVLALLHAARAAATLRGSEFVAPDDVKTVVPWVVPHRLTLTASAALEGLSDHALAQSLLERVPVPR